MESALGPHETTEQEEDMVTQSEIEEIREALERRRTELFALRKRLNEAWQDLQTPEVEFEEMAQKQKISQGMDRLDKREKEELEAIDMALRRIRSGSFGICESCGEFISFKRLKAIPWTDLCIDCASERELHRGRAVPAGIREEDILDETVSEDVSDGEIQASEPGDHLEDTILDKLQEDGRIDLEELEISYKNGKVYLEGALPSREEHHILLEIVEDVLDLHKVIDQVVIDPSLWEREDRARGIVEEEGKSEEEIILEGEDTEKDPYESLKSGEPLSPPDIFIPESELEEEEGEEEEEEER
jgi:DnaK suppressor protein